METLEAKSQRNTRVASDRSFLSKFGRAGMIVDLRVDTVDAQKTLHGTMITAGMAGLITAGKGFMNIAFGAKAFPPDRMDDRMTVAPEIGVFRLKSLDELKKFQRRVFFQRLQKELIETFSAGRAVHARFDGVERGETCR